MTDPSREDAEQAVRTLIQYIGEDPTRKGLQSTPRRVVDALREMTEGGRRDPQEALGTTFRVTQDAFVIRRNIRFTSLCEHHMLPFTGVAHIAYLPNGERGIVGLSKLDRVFEGFARRLQVQERLTTQVADAIEEALDPRGVAVIVKAVHQCTVCRGVRQSDADMVTSVVRGRFRTDHGAKNELMALLTI